MLVSDGLCSGYCKKKNDDDDGLNCIVERFKIYVSELATSIYEG